MGQLHLVVACLDQNPRTTSSLGIFQYTRRCLEALGRHPERPRITVIASKSNHHYFAFDGLEQFVVDGSFSKGFARLRGDHRTIKTAIRSLDATHAFFPKGWLPLFPPKRLTLLATLHDAIVHAYRKEMRGTKRTLKLHYFDAMTRHTLNRADRVYTVSEFSRQSLVQAYGPRADRVFPIPNGPGLVPNHSIPLADKEARLLVFGSTLPHKATAETMALLAEAGTTYPVDVVGLDAWPSDWPPLAPSLDVRFLGRLPDKDLAHHLAHSRAVIFLSHLEGFGLPVLEAVLAGTPVCYRNAHAVKELMAGAPGGWTPGQTSFSDALADCLAMSDDQIRFLRERLALRCSWDRVADQIIRDVREGRSSSSG